MENDSLEFNRGYNAAIEDLKTWVSSNTDKIPIIFRSKVKELYKALDNNKKEVK